MMTSKEENEMKQVKQGLRQGKWAPQCPLIQNHGWLESVVSTASKSLVFAGDMHTPLAPHVIADGRRIALQSWNLLQLLCCYSWYTICQLVGFMYMFRLPGPWPRAHGLWGVIRFWRTSIFEMKTTCPHPMCFGFKTPQNFKIVSKISRNH